MMDREIDLISPFMISQNYEGLLDEVYGIKTCSISVDNNIVYPDEKVREELKKGDGKTDFQLTSADAVFHDIRDKHFNVAGPTLMKKLEDIQRMMTDKN